MIWNQTPYTAYDVNRNSDLDMILSYGSIFGQRGTVEIVDRQVGVTTGTISVRGVFPNPGDILRPGQFAKVRAVIDMKKGALLVPQRAVREVQGRHEAGVVGTGDTVDVRKVQVADRVGSLWIIAQGLKPDDRVIVEGLDKVRAGEKIKPLPADPEPASARPMPGATPVAPPPPGQSSPPAAG